MSLCVCFGGSPVEDAANEAGGAIVAPVYCGGIEDFEDSEQNNCAHQTKAHKLLPRAFRGARLQAWTPVMP